MKIGIQGAGGLIGKNLLAYFKTQNVPCMGTYAGSPVPGLTHFDLRARRYQAFSDCSHVIICGGITSLDRCFQEQDLAREINLYGTVALIEYCTTRDIIPVFLSSDQVFDGKVGGYCETDTPHPINFYGLLKLKIEQFLAANCPHHLIFRLSKTYSKNPEDTGLFNEIRTQLKEGKPVLAAYNQIYNPTDVSLVCHRIHQAICRELEGLYHLADPTVKSRLEIASAFALELGYDPNVITKIDFHSLALAEPRALNSSLITSKIQNALD